MRHLKSSMKKVARILDKASLDLMEIRDQYKLIRDYVMVDSLTYVIENLVEINDNPAGLKELIKL